jgi:hypothetical protein
MRNGDLFGANLTLANICCHSPCLQYPSPPFSTLRRTAPALNFVDGDLVESFLDLDREQQDKVVDIMKDYGTATTAAPPAEEEARQLPDWEVLQNVTVDDVIRAVEEISRQH